jgi:hypothetical protein
VLKGTTVKRIFVDGGFSKNSIYMHLLAMAFPVVECFLHLWRRPRQLAQALVIHKEWNTKPIPNDIIEFTVLFGKSGDNGMKRG